MPVLEYAKNIYNQVWMVIDNPFSQPHNYLHKRQMFSLATPKPGSLSYCYHGY